LTSSDRQRLFIATKVGEHWMSDACATFVDHGSDMARRSIELSLTRLGRIDMLQIHKADASLLTSATFGALIGVIQEYGIPQLGVSLSDYRTFELARATKLFDFYQFPYNRDRPELATILDDLAVDNGTPVVNRPMAMGGVFAGDMSKQARDAAAERALRFVVGGMHRGVILTGTGDVTHLRGNMALFRRLTGDTLASSG
jgi:aryl-alcohol dehydrogenase-like predicted oxidoreductase